MLKGGTDFYGEISAVNDGEMNYRLWRNLRMILVFLISMSCMR